MTVPNYNQLKDYCDKEKLVYLGIFGSQARGDAKETSDIDVMIEPKNTKSFFELARIQDSLQTILGKKVDLVTKRNVKELLRPSIFKDLITIYEQR